MLNTNQHQAIGDNQQFAQNFVELPNTRQVDLGEAERFLTMLDPDTDKFTFQTFDDEKVSDMKDEDLTRVFHGTLKQHGAALTRLNERGAGVFVTINKTDLRGRKNENVVAVRKFFVDTDGAPIKPIIQATQNGGVPPSCVVESSPGNCHFYWDAECELEEFTDIQTALADKFGTDKNVKDLPRVMRLPGFYHQKRKHGEYVNECGPFLVRIVLPKGGLQ